MTDFKPGDRIKSKIEPRLGEGTVLCVHPDPPGAPGDTWIYVAFDKPIYGAHCFVDPTHASRSPHSYVMSAIYAELLEPSATTNKIAGCDCGYHPSTHFLHSEWCGTGKGRIKGSDHPYAPMGCYNDLFS